MNPGIDEFVVEAVHVADGNSEEAVCAAVAGETFAVFCTVGPTARPGMVAEGHRAAGECEIVSERSGLAGLFVDVTEDEMQGAVAHLRSRLADEKGRDGSLVSEFGANPTMRRSA